MNKKRTVNHRIAAAALALASILPSAARAAAFDKSHAAYDALLKRHVSEGFADYRGLKRDSKELDAYLDASAAVSKTEFDAWDKPDRLAYLINLYNAQTLRLILDHYGKIDSIKDIGSLFKGPWDMKIVRLFGEKRTLNELEHETIRKLYKEPRAHFALVCASIGCPPLREEAYAGSRLEDQLEDQGRRFLASAAKNRYDADGNTLYLSPIFKWFEDDFTAKAGSVTAFVIPYLPPEAARRLLKDRANVRVRYTDYDWKLNDRPRREDRRLSGS